MRILMLGWELPPHNSGGLGVACYQLCKALSRKGADIEFVLPYLADHGIDFMTVTAAHPQDVTEILKSGIAYDSYKYVYSDGRVETHDIYSQVHMYEEAVAQLVSKREFDIVHAHDWLTFRAALRAKQMARCPIVLHVHSVERDRAGGGPGNPLCREIEGISFMLADRIVAVSQHTKNMIVEDYNVPEDKVEVVHNSIDPDMFEPLDGDNTYKYLARMKSRGYRVVVAVSRLTVQKGLPNLLHAAREVVLREPKTLFLIVGSGEQYFELLSLAADLGIAGNVLFAGFQRGKRWRDAYAIADLFVMPSISEPFGLTALEAVGYGTPSLISRQSGVAEVLKNALKVDFWDVKEMANQITAVVQNDALRDTLHANSYQEFGRLNWNAAADKLLNIYSRHVEGAFV
ncbi:MAG TPA: glycosyltransferase family 4 protein [Candidatus Saccharimonadales bacterium]|nr:glycosyltransferase family 4 protein [Candidatus Saccharimonadales bacterium]